MKILLVASLVFLAGCSSFSMKQTDSSYDAKGKTTRSITTKASAWTLFSSKSELSKFRASQTDKSQSATVGSLAQESTGTNVVEVLRALSTLVGSIPK